MNGHHTELAPSFDLSSISLPVGFGWGDDGNLYELGVEEWKRGGLAKSPATLIAAPFHLVAVEKAAAGIAYKFGNLMKSGWDYFTIPAKIIRGMGGMAELAAHNVNVHSRDACLSYITKAIDMLNGKNDPVAAAERNGWNKQDRTFVCGDRIYKDGNNYKAPIGQELRARADELKPTGDYSAWKAAVNLMLGTGCKPQAFAVLCGFAAPLMIFESPTEGGCIVSLSHKNSGTGKTTAMQCAASIWGKWHVLNMTNQDTHNSRMVTLGTMNNLPVCYDDMVTLKPELLAALVDTYSEGKERARATTQGGLQRVPHTWNNILITSSNRSLIEVVDHISNSQAMGRRILELDCGDKLETPAQGKDYFKQVFADNYGWAGHAFLSYITHPAIYPKMLSVLKEDRKRIEQKYRFPNEFRFYERALAVCMAAAKLVKHMGLIHSIDLETVVTWVGDTLAEQMGGTVGSPVKEHDEAAHSLSRYIADTSRDFLIVDHGVTTRDEKCFVRQPPMRVMAGRMEVREQTLYVVQHHLTKWAIEHNVNLKDMLSKLKKSGLLQGLKTKNLGEGTDFPPTKTQTFVFDLRTLS